MVQFFQSWFPLFVRSRSDFRRCTGTKIPWNERRTRCLVQGTPRAWKQTTQINRTQLRAKSGTAVAVNGDAKKEEDKPAPFSGKAQTREAGWGTKSWLRRPALAGSAGAGCEPEADVAQQLILPPQGQQGRTGWLAHAGTGATSSCAHASNKLNKMADNRFTNIDLGATGALLVWRSVPLSGTELRTLIQIHFLAAAASWIFFR